MKRYRIRIYLLRAISVAILMVSLSIIACDSDDGGEPGYIEHTAIETPGPFQVGMTTIETLVDTSRSLPEGGDRPIPLEIAYPALAAGDDAQPDLSGAPYPILLISHGLIANKSIYRFLSSHMASHGYVVIAPDHVTSNTDYIMGAIGAAIDEVGFAGLLDDPDALMDIAGPKLFGIADEVYDRPLDISFVLDNLPDLNRNDPLLKGMLHPTLIGITGHSYGGYTTIAAAGGTINPVLGADCPTDPTVDLSQLFGGDEVDADLLGCLSGLSKYADQYRFPLDLSDDRILAAMPMAPATSALFGPDGMKSITIPMMLTGATEDTLTPYETEQLGVYPQLSQEGRYLYTLHGAGHLNFNDDIEKMVEYFAIPGLPMDLSAMDPEALSGLLATVGLDLGPLFTPSMEFDRGHLLVRSIATAFFGRHVKGDDYYDPFLTEEYVKGLSGAHNDASLEVGK